MTTEEEFAEIIEEALSKASDVKCGKYEYLEGLKSMRDEINIHIDAARESAGAEG